MAVRLVKIAKELNVGTATIVDFLVDNGFEIENKPTSKISDDMHDALLKEFSNSMAVKEKADQLVIGNRKEEKEEVPPTPEPPKVEKEVEPVTEEPNVEAEAESSEEPAKEESKSDTIEAKAKAPGLKVLGKIDLTPKPKKKKAAKATN